MRVSDLESELAEAEAIIARLRGEGASEVPKDAATDWFSGVPKQLYLERELPFAISEDGLETIAELANERVAGGSLANVGRTLTHRKGQYELRVLRTRGGRTKIRLVGDYSAGRLLLALAGPGAALLTGALPAGILEEAGASPPMILLAFLLAGIVGFFGLRKLLQRSSANDRATLTGLFEAVCDVAKQHRIVPGKVRVETGPSVEEEREAMAEQEAAAARYATADG